VLDPHGHLLRAAVGFAGCSMPSYDRALWALRTWLDSWTGIGHVAVGMHRQGYDLQLTQYDEQGWRATFYTTGMEHSPTSATGTGWEHTVARSPECGVGGAMEGRPMKIVEGGCTPDPFAPGPPRKPTKQEMEQLAARYVARADRFTYLMGWPWRTLRRVLRRARPGA